MAGDGGETSFGGGPNLDPGNSCAQQALQISPVVPTVELLVNRSASMTANFGALDRWNTVKAALVDPATGFVKVLQERMRFGLSLYSNPDPASCPNLVNVSFGLNSYQPISDAFAANEPMGDSPMGDSITAATALLAAVQDPGPKIMILTVNADPDSCADPTVNGEMAPRDLAIEAVQAAWESGISTQVVGLDAFGDGVDFLDSLAIAGAGGDPMAGAHNATNASELITAYQQVLAALASCDFQLNGTIDPDKVQTGFVAINGQQVPYDATNGWQVVDGNIIHFVGSACDSAQGATSLDINFPCGAVTFE